MPPLPAAGSTVRIQYDFTVGSDSVARCRQYWQYSGVQPTSAQLNTVASGISTNFGTNLLPLMSPSNSLTGVTLTDLSSPTGAIGVDNTVRAGTRAGGALPANICALQSLHILRRYRGGHPRTYWPFGVQTDLSTEQLWNAGFVSGMTTDLNNHYTSIGGLIWSGGGSWHQVNVSFYSGFTTHTGTTGRVRNVSTPRLVSQIDAVVNFTVQQGIGSQRKRLLRIA